MSVGLSDDSVPSLATKQPKFLRTVQIHCVLRPIFFPLSFNIIDNQCFFLRLKSQTNWLKEKIYTRPRHTHSWCYLIWLFNYYLIFEEGKKIWIVHVPFSPVDLVPMYRLTKVNPLEWPGIIHQPMWMVWFPQYFSFCCERSLSDNL